MSPSIFTTRSKLWWTSGASPAPESIPLHPRQPRCVLAEVRRGIPQAAQVWLGLSEGWEVVQVLRKEASLGTKVFALSSYSSDFDKLRSKEAGMDHRLKQSSWERLIFLGRSQRLLWFLEVPSKDLSHAKKVPHL